MLQRAYRFLAESIVDLERSLFRTSRQGVATDASRTIAYLAVGIQYIFFNFLLACVELAVLLFKSPEEGHKIIAAWPRLASETAQPMVIAYAEYERRHKRVRRASAWSFGVMIATIVITSVIVSLIAPAVVPALGATYTFSQTDWSGGATANNATHPTNQSSWAQYASKSAEITTVNGGADLEIASTTASVVKTSESDFTSGTFATATTTGAGSIQLTKAAHINEYTIGALANIAVTASTVTANSNGTWTIAFSGTPTLTRIFKNDKFTDSASKAWKVLSVAPSVYKIIVVDSEGNMPTVSAPATGSGTVGRWYASISAWEAGREGNLITRNAIERGLPYYDGAADTVAVTIDGWTTDASHRLEIYVPLSERHRGKWDNSKYRMSISGARAIEIIEDYTRIEGLQIDGGTSQAIFLNSSASNAYAFNNVIKNAGAGTYGVSFVYNNIVYDSGSCFWIRSQYDVLYNNTAYNCTNGFYSNSGSPVVKNNIAYNNTDNYVGSFSASSSNNLSGPAQTDAPGSNPQNAATVYFIDTVGSDFHLEFRDGTGNPAMNAGADLSADANLAFITDIDGDARLGTWDIGADDAGAVLVMTHSIGTASRDFSTLQAWEDARDGVLTTRNVFKIASQSGAFTAGETITGGTSGATGVYVPERATPSASETYMSLDIASGTFQAGETLTGGTSGKTATLSTILTTAGTVEKGEAYNDSTFTAGVTIDSSTTNASHYMWLTVEPGSRHAGVAGTGAKVSGTGVGVSGADPYSIIEWMEVYNTSSVAQTVYFGYDSSGAIFRSNIVHGNDASGSWGITGGGTGAVMYNNLVYDFATAVSAVTSYYYNNTVFSSATGFVRNNTPIVRNNVAAGNTADYNINGGSWDASSSNNISSDATAPGTSSLTSKSVSDARFVSTASDFIDLHIMDGSAAKDAGASLSFLVDIDRNGRTGTWDIGADEWFSSSPVYNTSGTFESATIDLAGPVSFSSLAWSPTTQLTNTTLTFRVATSSDGTTWNSPFVGSDGTASTYFTTSGTVTPSVVNGNRYVRYKAYFSTTDSAFTPQADDVTLNYYYYASSSPSLISSPYNSADATNILGKIAWTATTTASTEVRFQVRSAPNSGGMPGIWSSWCGYEACSDINTFTATSSNVDLGASHPLKNGGNDQWLQYKAFLVSTGYQTPTLGDVTLTYVVNAPPDFDASYGTNGISVAQNTSDGTVTINYKARDVDTSTGTVTPGYITPSFAYSLDGGSNWVAITSGYLGASDLANKAVTASYPGSPYTATWNAKSQINGTYNNAVKVKVTASDNEGANNTASAISGSFALDVKNPAATVTVNGTLSGASGAVSITSSDDSSYQMMLSNNSDFSADGLNASSGQWTSTSTSITWTFASSEPVRVYVKFKDSYQNETSVLPDAPSTPTSVTIQDTSSLALSEFREFVSWAVNGASDFGSYKMYRSTNGTSYSLTSTIAAAATNFYENGSSGAWLSNGTTYYYKLTAQDSAGNISRYSSVVSDIPDGQGGTDATSPTITSIAVASIKTTQATITWTTDELSDSMAYYSTNLSYGSSKVSSSMVTAHSVTLTGLSPGTTYNIRAKSVDPSANSAQVDAASPGSNTVANFSFTTASGPVISSVTTVSVAGSMATVVWNTNADSDSFVVYSTDSGLAGSQTTGTATLAGGPGPTYEHRVSLTGLTTNAKYYYKVRSTDASSNIAEDDNGGAYYTFSTTQDVTAPVISSVSAALASQTSAVVTWATNELADSQVLYGTDQNNLNQQTAVNATMTISHSMAIANLTAGTKYYYKVVSADQSANSVTSAVYNFTTDAQQFLVQTRYIEPITDTTAPLVTEAAVKDITDTGATVSWSTDEPADSFVEYGRTEQFGRTVGSFAAGQRHTVVLDNLLEGTEYFARARSRDDASNISNSKTMPFRTLTKATAVEQAVQKILETKSIAEMTQQAEQLLAELATKIAPPQISGVKPEVSVTSGFAQISWTTDRAANSIVAYAHEKDYVPGAGEPYATFVGNPDESVTAHTVLLSNLLPGTLYHFQVRSKGVVGNVGVSDDFSFTTKEELAIAGIEIKDITKDAATIFWRTNMPATTKLEYGLSTGYSFSQADDALNISHTAIVKGLAPGTFYHFRVGGTDERGAAFYSPDLTFTTESLPSVLDVKIDAVHEREMAVRWFTTVPADSTVEYTNTATGKTESVNDKQLIKNHAMTITGLAQDTQYEFRVASRDEKGNAVTSSTYNLQTIKDAQAPAVTNIQTQSAVTSGDKVQTIVSWKTDEPATQRVTYQEGIARNPALERSSPLEQDLKTNHVVVFTSFKPGAVYRLRIESADAAGNVGIARDFTILTPQRKETVVDLIVKNFRDVFKWVGKIQ